MKIDAFELLRCPYCGGRLELVESLFHRRDGDTIVDGILGCHCCVFPVVDGIAVMHLEPEATTARAHLEAGRADLARRALFMLEAEEESERFEAAAASTGSTYREIVEALGPRFEGGYFLYRFADPTYVVAEAVVRSIAAAVLRDGGRAVDLCGGSGHLTRVLLDLSREAPVLADLHYSKVWLARRFTAPGCEGVCCDGNGPLPFARGVFQYAMCSDAFQYIWTKRRFVLEMLRLIGDGLTGGAAVINHTHNQRQWSPSHGQPLPPEGYRDLFETVEPRLFAEAGLLDDIVAGGPLDLSRCDGAQALDADPALTIVATRRTDLYAPYPLTRATQRRGELRINPLYTSAPEPSGLRLTLTFPSSEYEDEYGACRRYLPETAVLDRATAAALDGGPETPALDGLLRQRVVLDLPPRYY